MVPSANNLADSLTRVPNKWLQKFRVAAGAAHNTEVEEIRKIHNRHHLGIERTLFVARKSLGDSITRSQVKKVVEECNTCRRIDPSPVQWEHGRLSVETVWTRLAMDFTHFNGKIYLSIVDCGPSRFAIWRNVMHESAEQVILHLKQIFFERGHLWKS